MLKQIDREELRRKLAGATRPVLVEALPEKYWRDWRLPGARHLPHDEVDRLASRVLPDKDAEIVGKQDRKSTSLNSSHRCISYAVFCLKKKKRESDNLILGVVGA